MKNCHLFTILAIAAFCAVTAAAQTLSNCRTDTPFNANSKPGVVGLELSRDERTILTAGADAKVRYIDVATGSVVKTLTGHTNSLYKAIYSPDERLIATSSRDHTARIWDAATGELLHTLGGFRCSVKAVAFSPDGRTIGASGNDGMLKLWDVKTGRELRSLVHKNSTEIDMSTYSFVFGRGGKRIFAANGDGTISEWDASTGREVANWKAHEPSQIWMAITRDRERFATLRASTVKIWDARTHQLLRTLEMPRAAGDSPFGGALAFSRDGRLIAASDSGLDQKGTSYLYVQTVVWDAETGKQLFVLKNQKFDIDALQFTRDGHTLLTGSVDATIDLWDTATGHLTRTISLTGK